VTFVDDAGEACLAAMHHEGAEFIAADPLTKGIIAEITRGPPSTRQRCQNSLNLAHEEEAMTNLDTLINRIDQEIAAEVERQKAGWAEVVLANRERELRLQRYETEAKHIIELVKPRLDAFIERFKAVVKAEPVVRQHTRAVNLTFAATVANVTLRFEVFPDRDVNHIRLECTQEIIPVLVRYDKQSVLEFTLDGVQDDAVVKWFDDRIVAFVKAYIALVLQDAALQEQLKDQFVEDPVARIRFPKYLASSTLERDGQTYYFVDEETRREFEKQPAAQ
jgi:YHS domain-containing protein